MRQIAWAPAVLLAAGLMFLAPAAGAQTVGRSDGQTVGRVTTDAMAARLDSMLARMADWGALIQAESRWRFARLGNDATLLDSLLVDEWTATVWNAHGNISGGAETKGHYLADVKSGTRSYRSIVEEGTDVRINGSSAVVSGQTTSKGYLNDELVTGASRFIRTYAKQLGRWRMTSSHSTAVVL